MAEPKRGVAYEFFLSLVDSANSPSFRPNPTIAAGDFRISIDGGAFADLATLPVVAPAGSSSVQLNLSAAEMDGDKIVVQGVDVAGAEWEDVTAFIDAPAATVDDLSVKAVLIEKIMRNKMVTDPVTGVVTIFDDNGIDVLVSSQLYEDAGTVQTYRGRGAQHRGRMT